MSEDEATFDALVDADAATALIELLAPVDPYERQAIQRVCASSSDRDLATVASLLYHRLST